MTSTRFALRSFAVRAVIWRHYLDWAVTNVPFYLQPILLFFSTVFFYAASGAPRRALVANLGVVFPRSSRVMNYLRAFRVIWNFSWSIAEAANYKQSNTEFTFEIEGADYLDQLARGRGAIVLTAHMGSYDLGAGLFAQKLGRALRMVRVPEPDARTAEHLTASVKRTSAGAVKIDYNQRGAMLSFDLLSALRAGEIVSIQGDRVIPGMACAEGELFGRQVPLPSGPFILAVVAETPIFPLFILRRGYRRYRIVVREPIVVRRTTRARDDDIAQGVAAWSEILEKTIGEHWDQWSAFVPVFSPHGGN